MIVAFRDSDLGNDHPLSAVLADLRRVEGVQRIALEGLGEAEVSEVMAAVAGHELDADGLMLAGEIASETDGNPFFVGEVLRSLVESGRLLYDSADRAVERRPFRATGLAAKRPRRDRSPCRPARGRGA